MMPLKNSPRESKLSNHTCAIHRNPINSQVVQSKLFYPAQAGFFVCRQIREANRNKMTIEPYFLPIFLSFRNQPKTNDHEKIITHSQRPFRLLWLCAKNHHLLWEAD